MANAKFANTVIKFEMMDAEVEMTLQMFALHQLRVKNRKTWSWDRYNKITQGKGEEGEFDYAYLLYTGYLCQCVSTGADDRYGSFEEFLRFLPSDNDAIMDAYRAMKYPKKA